MNLTEIKKKILDGGDILPDEAHFAASCNAAELLSAAAEVTEKMASRDFEMCSIVNAKSGRCPENCKWCAQSVHFPTGVSVHPFVGRDECLRQALQNEKSGIHRFSLVASGRRPTKKEMDEICETFAFLNKNSGISLCASLGLLEKEDLERLAEAGVGRYHCNLETSASFFPSLCTTHTQTEKRATLRHAKMCGMDICSGGIIGMGESLAQRIELAFELKNLGTKSIPINILSPIRGTPLEAQPPFPDDEILATIALFRLINPRAQLRFAGGRSRLDEKTVRTAFSVGINAAIVGDLLTTLGSKIADDKKMIQECGYKIRKTE